MILQIIFDEDLISEWLVEIWFVVEVLNVLAKIFLLEQIYKLLILSLKIGELLLVQEAIGVSSTSWGDSLLYR